jgi:hypothetical protein
MNSVSLRIDPQFCLTASSSQVQLYFVIPEGNPRFARTTKENGSNK